METKTEERADYYTLSVGLCYASVCTCLPVEEVERRLNAEHPTGLSSRWVPAEDPTFAGGEPNPGPCNQWPETHTHYLFWC